MTTCCGPAHDEDCTTTVPRIPVVVEIKDQDGRLVNRMVSKVFDSYQDVYAKECKLN